MVDVDNPDANTKDAGSSNPEIAKVEAEPKGRFGKIRPLWLVLAAVFAVIVIVVCIVGALIARKIIPVGGGSKSTSASDPGAPSNSKPVVCPTSDDIPESAKGTWTDPSSWLDARDFNCTFTDETVGGLPTIGLYSTWDDSIRANSEVPPLNEPWGSYTDRPFRGVNLGGWLSLEPFITPSLFETNSSFVDEYSLSQGLGPKAAAELLEKHYSTFVTEEDLKNIAAAGLDHVRIPYSYWAVKIYPDDPYVPNISWRYLLRGIEWARKHGLRVKLDLHAVPGSQNGWNHSGKIGTIGWLRGENGTLNANRTLELHAQLSAFFAQPRYKNIVIFYGLVNEPSPAQSQDELVAWTSEAYRVVNASGITAMPVFSDSMLGFTPWAGKLPGLPDNPQNPLVIDAHMYTIFDNNLIQLSHTSRLAFACNTWTAQIIAGVDTSAPAGFGPAMIGEWSQADTDCTKYLNGVGDGARWNGTLSTMMGEAPMCPTRDSRCSCAMAGSPDVADFSDEYKRFLSLWAQAQMFAFEKSWGWFYWTWKTESAPLWSYQGGMEAGLLPKVAWQREFNCEMPLPTFEGLEDWL